MSRMAMPAMEVVRFKEADIIVASGSPIEPKPGARVIRLSNFNNGTSNDGMVDNLSIANFIDVLKLIDGHADGVFFEFGDNSVRADGLLTNEENSALANGDYYEDYRGNDVVWKFFNPAE